jgi:AbrB family looped-hinge helix DNA binding protein
MSFARSRLTAQGQISIPARVRRKLGLGPGSVIEWEEHGDTLIVRKAGRFNWQDIRNTLFPEGPPATPPLPTREAITQAIRRRHARR